MFTLTRFWNTEVLFHIVDYYLGKDNRSLYRGICYIDSTVVWVSPLGAVACGHRRISGRRLSTRKYFPVGRSDDRKYVGVRNWVLNTTQEGMVFRFSSLISLFNVLNIAYFCIVSLLVKKCNGRRRAIYVCGTNDFFPRAVEFHDVK